jgi:hypothetical protein
MSQSKHLFPYTREYRRAAPPEAQNVIPGLPVDSDPPELRREPESMERVVAAVMKTLNIEMHEWIHDLRAAWPQILPADIASRTQPAKFENQILFVSVVSSVALFELRRSRLKEIETAVRRFAPDRAIRHVQLAVNHVHL